MGRGDEGTDAGGGNWGRKFTAAVFYNLEKKLARKFRTMARDEKRKKGNRSPLFLFNLSSLGGSSTFSSNRCVAPLCRSFLPHNSFPFLSLSFSVTPIHVTAIARASAQTPSPERHYTLLQADGIAWKRRTPRCSPADNILFSRSLQGKCSGIERLGSIITLDVEPPGSAALLMGRESLVVGAACPS